jgi:hypothetical protein
MTRQHDEGDPPLVRPYIEGRLGGSTTPTGGDSRPAWAVERAEVLPAYPDPAATVALPRVRDPEPAAPPHRRLLLAGLALILLSVAGLGLAVSLRPEPPQALPADIPLIRIPPSALPTTTEARPSDSRWPEPEQPPATVPAAATAPSKTPTAKPSRSAVRATPTPAATLSPVPAVARTGAIRTDAGLCLTYTGGYPYGGAYVQVFGCMNGAAGQVWTLATDGTLRTFDRCAEVDGGGGVRMDRCDGDASAQWRAGRKESLVNVATNDCLTVSSSGSRYGVGVRLSDCTGAADQQWRLP